MILNSICEMAMTLSESTDDTKHIPDLILVYLMSNKVATLAGRVYRVVALKLS